MDEHYPRYSTSEVLLEHALEHAKEKHELRNAADPAQRPQVPPLRGVLLQERARLHLALLDHADGSRPTRWTRSTKRVVHWADVVLVATPIRWGAASSLYYKMIERMNCIQNQITIAQQVLIRNKAAGFIITGGQDNIQAVAGQMLAFFTELGFVFPQFPFIAHSRGWSAEDMERNVEYVRQSAALRQGRE